MKIISFFSGAGKSASPAKDILYEKRRLGRGGGTRGGETGTNGGCAAVCPSFLMKNEE